MSKFSNDHQSLQDVLKDFVVKNKLDKGLDEVNVKEAWYASMGPAISKYTQAIKYKNHVLYVSLTSSVLREELSYGKQKIIDNLNTSLQSDKIKKLVLR